MTKIIILPGKMHLQQIWHQQQFLLYPNRTMYWENNATLIASDLHLGKSGHFRKHGIAVPQQLFKEDLIRLFTAVEHSKANRLLIVGDLVHSHANKELGLFEKWRKDYSRLEIVLVKGNHDILSSAWYADAGITVVNHLQENGLFFIHEPPAEITAPTICGHIHPGVRLGGGARQSLRFPCFYFGAHTCILPAFGLFTGTHAIRLKKSDNLFAIVNHELIKI